MHRFLAACSLLFLLPFSARASGSVFISEAAWAGSTASLADEWFELCGPPAADLSGWSVSGASASPIALPEGAVVPASGAFLIANYAADDAKSTLNAMPDLVTTTVSLSNSALSVALKDASGTSVDAAGDGGAPPAGASGAAKASMERVSAETWMTAVTSSGFDEGAAEFGSPGTCAPFADAPTETAEPEPAASATTSEETPPPPASASASTAPPPEPLAAVRVTEIFPSPEAGAREWIELANLSGIGEFLDGWSIEDASGAKTPLSGLLMPWARAVIESPKGALNNDGDTVILKDRFGRILDRVEYPKARKGEAYMRVELRDAFAVTRTPTPGAANVLTPTEDAPAPAPPPPDVPNEAEVVRPSPVARASAAAEMPKPAAVVKELAAARPAPKKPAPKPKAAPAPRYKGDGYVATVVTPPGVYSKTRAYIQRNGAIEELRLSKSASFKWSVGDEISFIAQSKSEGAVEFLLANPNSVRTISSASATFATTEAWPEEAGGYRFTAEVASVRGDALEVKLAGVEGDVLAPSGSAAALKPGDTVSIEGFIEPGARPRVVLPYTQALRLFKAYLPEDAGGVNRKLPAPLAAGLTGVAGAVGLIAYLRSQRLKRLALAQTPIEEGAWE